LFLQDWVDQNNTTARPQPIQQATPVFKQQVPKQTHYSPPSSTSNTSATTGPIKRLQPVKHATFGFGIAHHIEQKGEKFIVTVQFTHHGSKKIDSTFLEII